MVNKIIEHTTNKRIVRFWNWVTKLKLLSGEVVIQIWVRKLCVHQEDTNMYMNGTKNIIACSF
jgi:hypothetical protein